MPTLSLLVTGDDFVRIDSLSPNRPTYESILAMINDRRTNCGLTAKTWTDLYGSAITPFGRDVDKAVFNWFRTILGECFGRYVNTSVHTGGSLNGAVSTLVTTWTRPTILTAAGVGGLDGFSSRNWTNVPASGHAEDLSQYTGNLFGTSVALGMTIYKEWVNEIILVCRKLTHVPLTATQTAKEEKVTFARNWTGEDDPVFPCSDSFDTVNFYHSSTPWGRENDYAPVDSGFGYNMELVSDFETEENGLIAKYYQSTVFSDEPVHSTTALARNIRGKINMNLTAYTGTAKVFLWLTAPSGGTFGQTRPVTTGDTYDEWTASGVSTGINWTSGYVDHSDDVPAQVGSCGTPASATEGWFIIQARVVVAPAFTYL